MNGRKLDGIGEAEKKGHSDGEERKRMHEKNRKKQGSVE